MSAELDIIHTSPMFASALEEHYAERGDSPYRQSYFSWSEFAQYRDTSAPYVLLDAFLDDHVPLLVKVRALHRLRRSPIVVGPLLPEQCEVLSREGALRLITEELSVPELALEIDQAISEGATPLTTLAPPGAPSPLTDRELQLTELYARRRALSCPVLSTALGLNPDTVRVHLKKARKKIALLGLPCSSRAELSTALTSLGYSLTDEQWKGAARW